MSVNIFVPSCTVRERPASQIHICRVFSQEFGAAGHLPQLCRPTAGLACFLVTCAWHRSLIVAVVAVRPRGSPRLRANASARAPVRRARPRRPRRADGFGRVGRWTRPAGGCAREALGAGRRSVRGSAAVRPSGRRSGSRPGGQSGRLPGRRSVDRSRGRAVGRWCGRSVGWSGGLGRTVVRADEQSGGPVGGGAAGRAIGLSVGRAVRRALGRSFSAEVMSETTNFRLASRTFWGWP